MVYKVYRRPSIDLDAQRRTWEYRKPYILEEGAIVPDYGEVTDVQVSDAEGSTVLKFSNGKSLFLEGSDIVYCFQ